MDDDMRVVAAGPADDIIARIMSEIEDVIGLIQSSPAFDRTRIAGLKATDDSAAAALAGAAA